MERKVVTAMSKTVELAKKWYQRLAFPEKYDAAFETLTNQYSDLPEMEFSPDAFGKTPEDGGKNLLLCLYFCEALAEKFAAKGIPERVLLDTLLDIVLWTDTHYTLTGKLGFSETGWMRYHFEFRLFRLGRLQFAVGACDRDIPQAGVEKGDTVLEVHIPRGGGLTEEACDASFAAAKDFFSRYFPEVTYKCFTCFSWLLDDTLEQFMRQDANILKFQRRFQVVDKIESLNILQFTVNWGINKENMDSFTPTNSFTQKAMEFVKNGGAFYIVFGYIPVHQ